MADIADAASGQEHGAGPEWLLTGIAYFGCACLVCLLCIVAFVFTTRKNPLLDLGYFVYVNTALGQWIHNLQLAQVRQRAAKARKAGEASGAFHSAVESLEVSICPTADEADGVEVTVIPLPCLKDNYQYLVLHTPKADGLPSTAFAVDVADAEVLFGTLREVEGSTGRPVHLTHVLITHRHMDHCGGLALLLSEWASERPGRRCPEVVASALDPTPYATRQVWEGATVHLTQHGDGFAPGSTAECLVAHVRGVPGHTRGHVWFYVTTAGSPSRHRDLPAECAGRVRSIAEFSDAKCGKCPGILFSGDTLFVGGIGRLFEGQPSQMVTNLYRVGGAAVGAGSTGAPSEFVDTHLPLDALVLTGHEYSVDNLDFCRWLLPENGAVQAKRAWCLSRREGSPPRCTAVTTLREEASFNVFMMCHDPALRGALAALGAATLSKARNGSEIDVDGCLATIQGARQEAASFDKTLLAATLGLLRALKDCSAHK